MRLCGGWDRELDQQCCGPPCSGPQCQKQQRRRDPIKLSGTLMEKWDGLSLTCPEFEAVCKRERKRWPATCSVALQHKRAVDMSPLVELRLRPHRWVNPSVGWGGDGEKKFSLSQSETEAFGSPLSIKVHADLLVTPQPQWVCVSEGINSDFLIMRRP